MIRIKSPWSWWRDETFPIFVLVALVLLNNSSISSSSSLFCHGQENQVQLRVFEKIDQFIKAPVNTLQTFHDYFDYGGFSNNMRPTDRAQAQMYMYSLLTGLNETGMKPFYGLEDGTLLGYWHSLLKQVPILVYREPGNSGYNTDDDKDVALWSRKYYDVCMDETTGAKEKCSMTPDSPMYVSCNDDCALIKCPSLSTPGDLDDVDEMSSWCINYGIVNYTENSREEGGSALGFVPTTHNCIDKQGDFAQEPGTVLVESENGIIRNGTCKFIDGSPVDRVIYRPYANCANVKPFEGCNTTFIGAHEFYNYDHRWRGWYMDSREAQIPRFSDPYIFINFGTVGITYTHPIFITDNQDGRRIFHGVLAVDMELANINEFLVKSLSDTNFAAAIYEVLEPNKMIGVSTGSTVMKWTLKNNPSQECTQKQSDVTPGICLGSQLDISNFEKNKVDVILRKAHYAFVDNGYGTDKIVAVREDDNDVASTSYLATSLVYEQPDANLMWRIVVTFPFENGADDVIVRGDDLFVLLCTIGGLGFFLCLLMFLAFYRSRNEKAVQYSDFPFTAAFIVGCACINLSTFLLLGDITDDACLLRIWSFFMLSSMMLSPLFIKAYRTYKFLGNSVASAMSAKMNNFQAWIRTLPILFIQMIILLFFTFSDPPLAAEKLILDVTKPVKRLHCRGKSDAFFYVQGLFILILLGFGCVLAYLTRNIDPRFCDAKALLFAMYNIAFTAIAMITITIDISGSGKSVLQATGVFWVSVFSAAAFVLPRLMTAKKDRDDAEKRKNRQRSKLTHIRSTRMQSLVAEAHHFGEEGLKILVCTANMGNAPPTLESMKAWIPEEGSCASIPTLDDSVIPAAKFDLIVIGMQEATWDEKKSNSNKSQTSLDPLRSIHIEKVADDDELSLEEAKCKEDAYLSAVEGADAVALRKMMGRILGNDYTNIVQEQRGQMRQTVWALNDVAPFLENIKVSGANTGIGNVLANKGGIVVSMIYQETRLTFLSAHLTAHEGKKFYQHRCENVSDILQSSKTFDLSQDHDLDLAICSHHMFVCGDLNFRTKFDGENNTHEDNVKRAKALIAKKNWSTLYSFDELHRGVKDGDLLVGFNTLPCNFYPTFKVNRKGGYDYTEQRCPSYTDRILFKSAANLSKNIKQLSYEPCVDFITSDHKPVRGAFTIMPNEIFMPMDVENRFRINISEIECCDLLAADANGLSDPYISFIWENADIKEERKNNFLTRGKNSYPKTNYKRNTLNPSWPNETISLVTTGNEIRVDAMLYLIVYDYDIMQDDDILGTLPLSVHQLLDMRSDETSKELLFDRPLERYGKFGGRIRFKLELSLIVG